MIKTVFLDLDDTVLDFHLAEREAISKTLLEFGKEPAEDIISRYSEINLSLWKSLERGEAKREEILVRRFEILFGEIGIHAPALKARDAYEKELSTKFFFMPGAKEVLESLSGKYSLYLASNGTARVQEGRILASGIAKYFRDIFISEKIGYNKPSALYFEHCFSKIPDFERQSAIIVGDSLSSDIQGGINAKIRTCLYNPKSKKNTTGILPDYEIKSLSELPLLLERI